MNPRVSRFAYILRLCMPFKWSFLKTQHFFCCPNPPWFLQPEAKGIYLPGTGTLGCVVWPGVGITCSQDNPTNFHPPHKCGITPTHSTSTTTSHHTTTPHRSTHPCFSALPTHLDECGLFKSLVVGLPYNLIFWQFWALFVLRCSCNSFCGCERRWSMSTYTSMVTRCRKSGRFLWRISLGIIWLQGDEGRNNYPKRDKPTF